MTALEKNLSENPTRSSSAAAAPALGAAAPAAAEADGSSSSSSSSGKKQQQKRQANLVNFSKLVVRGGLTKLHVTSSKIVWSNRSPQCGAAVARRWRGSITAASLWRRCSLAASWATVRRRRGDTAALPRRPIVATAMPVHYNEVRIIIIAIALFLPRRTGEKARWS